MRMTNKRFGIFLLLLAFFSLGAQAQLVTSMKINEVLVINETNFVDDYGARHPWIELFNNSAGTVDLGGCYLTNEKSQRGCADKNTTPATYPILGG